MIPAAAVSPLESDRLMALGLAVLETEARAVAALAGRIDQRFVAACSHLLRCRGRVVVLGMGKSGHIAGKIAATLASTGTPAFFVHPAEASHGDLGMIAAEDVAILLSNSGETRELLLIVPILKRLGVPLIALTGRSASTLAQIADVALDVGVAQEACPLGLAPTASTTAALAMGDALAVALLEARGFTAQDFARSHPGGSLGRRLLLHVADIMHTGEEVPWVTEEAHLPEALLEMTRKGLGMTAVVNQDAKVSGIFTDGDLRRVLERPIDLRATPVRELMTRACRTASSDLLAAEALQQMQRFRINGLLIVDQEQRLVGAINMHDLLRAGVV